MADSLPNPDLVGDLFWGVFKPQWIRLALTLGIFTSAVIVALLVTLPKSLSGE